MIDKDLILISAYCDTPEKESVLRELVGDLQKIRDKFDLMIVSHTTIPKDISERVNYSFYDGVNDLLYDWDLRNKPWFSPGEDRAILSIFTSSFSTHLAAWRIIILGNGIAKNLGYKKVHYLEYDTRISNFSELLENSFLLESHDSVFYKYRKNENTDPVLLGSYQAYRLDTLDSILIDLDPERIKNLIRSSTIKSSEGMLENLLKEGKRFVEKNTDLLFNQNTFMSSESLKRGKETAWCLPYYDRLTSNLGFVIWNMEEEENSIDVILIYNNNEVWKNVIKPQHWTVFDIDSYENSNELIVILNGKIRNHFKFFECREEFKEASFREEFIK